MSAQHTPGPWNVEHWSGGEGYAAGFYVARSLGNGSTEWLKSDANPRRARRFATAELARAAIGSTSTPPSFVTVRISATIDNEYANRQPDFLPLEKLDVGRCHLTLDEARAVLADAEYNSDTKAQDVGEYGMPLPIFNAYRALAKQLREAIAKAGGAS